MPLGKDQTWRLEACKHDKLTGLTCYVTSLVVLTCRRVDSSRPKRWRQRDPSSSQFSAFITAVCLAVAHVGRMAWYRWQCNKGQACTWWVWYAREELQDTMAETLRRSPIAAFYKNPTCNLWNNKNGSRDKRGNRVFTATIGTGMVQDEKVA